MTKNVGGKARCTLHIGRRVTQSIFRAFDYADAIGTPLNFYVVVHLNETDQACAATLFERIRHKFRDWLNYKGKTSGGDPLTPSYIYAFENPANESPHINWGVHVPPGLIGEFHAKLPGWIEKVQGPLGHRTCRVLPIERQRAKRLAKYIVKGTEAGFVDHFFLRDLTDAHGPQGEVWGKRAGVSPSLGPAVRRAARFRPRRHRQYSSEPARMPAATWLN